jgi:Complex I intermediate-associated protein 30 (CIA30)
MADERWKMENHHTIRSNIHYRRCPLCLRPRTKTQNLNNRMVPRISGGASAASGGGGWIRRYWHFQECMWRHMWQTSDLYPYAPVALFDFTRIHDKADAARGVSQQRRYDGWRIADDRVIGGYSHANCKLMATTRDLYEYNTNSKQRSPEQQQQSITAAKTTTMHNNNDNDLKGDNDDENDDDQPLARPFLRWTGHLDTTIGMSSRAQRSGFAALKSPEFGNAVFSNGANLRGAYSALEIVCRTDGRVYTVQLEICGSLLSPSSGVNVYKGHIDVEATPLPPPNNYIGERHEHGGNGNDNQQQQQQQQQQYWDVLYLPFSDFSLSDNTNHNHRHMGGYSDRPRLDNKVCIESIGFTLMDGKDGPFCFDLARIRAVNFYNRGGVWEGIEKQQQHKRRQQNEHHHKDTNDKR